MGIFGRLFARKPEDLLAKGEKQLAAGSFYEARCSFEEGIELCGKTAASGDLLQRLQDQISVANTELALRNIEEASHAISQGNQDKAEEHLHLAKSLTTDRLLREKADILLASLGEKINNTAKLEKASSCSSCSSCSPGGHSAAAEAQFDEGELDSHIHYDLLIHQLPEEMYGRYSCLGEDFACMFIAASREEHKQALELLEAWQRQSADDDIYWYEKGKILHQLGSVKESEACFRTALRHNAGNPLAHLGLSLLLIEASRFNEAGELLDAMIANNIFAGQSTMLRAELFQITGMLDNAIDLYSSLLKSPLAKAAAEKLYEILTYQGRLSEAAALHKQYLKCGGH